MNITIVHKTAILPVTKYGGTERVVWDLAKGLSSLGHKVTLLIKQGGNCPFAKIQEIDTNKPVSAQIPANSDIVHFTNQTENVEKPHITTIHGNYSPRIDDLNVVFVSQKHAALHGSQSYVYNGIDWSVYKQPELESPRKYFHFLANAAWRVKNVKGAIKLIQKLPGEHLHVLGGHRLNLKMGFRLTLNLNTHFHGMVDDSKKGEIIAQSKGLFFPVLWHEPFGLALIESLYLGAPVFGTPYGSLPELITPDVGYLCSDICEMAEHIKAHRYSPKTCHLYAKEFFSATAMAKGYLSAYERVISGETLNTQPLGWIAPSTPFVWE